MTDVTVPMMSSETMSAAEFRKRARKAWSTLPTTYPKFKIGDIVAWTGFWKDDRVGMVVGVTENVSGWSYTILQPDHVDGSLRKIAQNEKALQQSGEKEMLKLIDSFDPKDW